MPYFDFASTTAYLLTQIGSYISQNLVPVLLFTAAVVAWQVGKRYVFRGAHKI